MNKIKITKDKDITTFEDIKHIDENGNEYWLARELMPLLEYSKWENFHKVIKSAMITCQNSGNQVDDCFPEVRKPIISGKGRKSFVIDYHLSRYACYIIAQNGDSRKKVIALAQTYFAIQTRKQELSEKEYSDELIANLFRISQTEQKLKKDKKRKKELQDIENRNNQRQNLVDKRAALIKEKENNIIKKKTEYKICKLTFKTLLKRRI